MLTLLLALLSFGALPRRFGPMPKAAPFPVRITLGVRAAAGEATVEQLPGVPAAPRPVVALKSGETPRIRWRVTGLDPRNPVPHLVVHLLIRAADAAGRPVPDEFQEGSVLDTVLGTDLAPRGTTEGEINTALFGAGVYQAEVELRDAAGARRGYAAVDLKVAE